MRKTCPLYAIALDQDCTTQKNLEGPNWPT